MVASLTKTMIKTPTLRTTTTIHFIKGPESVNSMLKTLQICLQKFMWVND
jgi:hypothetical protein